MSRRRRAPPSQAVKVVAAAVLAGVMAWAAPAASRTAANEAAEGRKHAERASHLAAKGKCRQALGEYDKAIAVLHDPTLLFNRGECHRKLGNVEAALEDYNQFLSDLPNAPNRTQVEARIAELRAQDASVTAAGTASGAPGVSGAPAPLTSPTPRHPPAGAPSAPPVAPPPRLDAAPPTPAKAAVLTEPVEAGPAGVSGSPAAGADSLSRRPLFWVALGVVVVGVGLGTYFVLGRDPTNVPRSDLGNYRF